MPQVKGDVIKNRAKLLREAGKIELQKYLKTQVGRTLSVIIEKDGVGKSENFLDVKITDSKYNVGDIVEVKIVAAEKYHLVGEYI